jgi:altronate dehydratase
MKSYRTTILGVLTIIATLTAAGISLLNGHSPDLATTTAGVAAGVGLIKAADHADLTPKP